LQIHRKSLGSPFIFLICSSKYLPHLQTKPGTENHWVHLPKESLGSSPKITVSSSSTDFHSSSFDFLWSIAVVVFDVQFSSSRPKHLPKTQSTTMKTQIFHPILVTQRRPKKPTTKSHPESKPMLKIRPKNQQQE
jgi:hypothetical protein